MFFYRPGTLHDFRSHEIADQLTLLDAELFYKIEVRWFSPHMDLHWFALWGLASRGPELTSTLLLISLRFQKFCFGQRSRMRRKVQTWLNSQSTLTTWAIGKTRHETPWSCDGIIKSAPSFTSLEVLTCLVFINAHTSVVHLSLPLPLSYRVRSLIIQQEKAQDREKLLLKFIKIMKVRASNLKNKNSSFHCGI